MDHSTAETSMMAEWLTKGIGWLSDGLASVGDPLTPAGASTADQVQNGIVVVVCVCLIIVTLLSWYLSRQKFLHAISWMRSMLSASEWSLPLSMPGKVAPSADTSTSDDAADSTESPSATSEPGVEFRSDMDATEWKFWNKIEDLVSSARDDQDHRRRQNEQAKRRTDTLLQSAFNLSLGERSGGIGQQYLPILMNYGTLISPSMDFRQAESRPQQIYSIGLFFTFLLIIGGLLTAPNHDNMVSIIISKALISVVAIACAGCLTVVFSGWDTIFDRQCTELRKAFAQRNNIRISGEKFDVAIVNTDEPIPFVPVPHEDATEETKSVMSQQTIVDIARLNRVLATLKDAQDQLENESSGLGTISGTAKDMHKALQGIQVNFGKLLSETEKIAEGVSAISDTAKDSG